MLPFRFITLVCTILICLSPLCMAADIDVDQDSNDALDVGYGGTNSATAAAARTALGLVIGTDVLAPNGSAASLTNIPFGSGTDLEASGALSADVVAPTEMADADHGDVSWTTGAATVEAMTVADNESTAETNAVLFLPGGDLDGGAGMAIECDGDLNYNPSTGTLSATAFSGDYNVGNINDNVPFQDSDATTKKFRFDAGSVTAGQTRVITIRDANGTMAYTGDNLGSFAATTSAQLYGTLSDETGSGSGSPLAVFNQAPTIDSPTFTTAITAAGLINEPHLDATNAPTDNYVLTYNAAGTNFTWEADQTGGTPSWDTVGDPVADATVAHDAGEETSFTFTGNYTTGSQFLVQQLTGNPTGGVLFEARGADSDSKVARFGDGTNYWQVGTDGELANAGTGTINLATNNDIEIAGTPVTLPATPVGKNTDHDMWKSVGIDASAFIADSTGTNDPAELTINSGPTVYAVETTDADNNLQFSIPMPENWDGGNIYVELIGSSQEATPSGTLEFEIKVQARGDDDLINNTWVGPVNLQYAALVDTQYDVQIAESAVLAAAGAGGDKLFVHAHRDYDDVTNCTSTQSFYINAARVYYQTDDMDERD